VLCKGDRNLRVFKESISIKYGKIVIFSNFLELIGIGYFGL